MVDGQGRDSSCVVCVGGDGVLVGLFVSSLVDSSLVRERGDCLGEAIAWFEARVGCLG